jgi:DNA-binding transcriptional LysR family regulator
MDIKQLKYFLTIVDSDFNLSAASKKLHVSQPALSLMIKNFEEEENVLLFERANGRLQNLTPVGEVFYANAQAVIEQYQYMMDQLREEATKMKGKIKIGIPPVVISVIFSEVMADLILNNPDIKFEIIELGAYALRKKLLLQEMDIAILLKPTNIDHIDEILLAENELCAYMDKNNPLANCDQLTWIQLNNQPLAIFDNTFMIHHLLINKFNQKNVKPIISLTSSSWDFLLRSTSGTDLITILPSLISEIYFDSNITKVHFKDPLSWEIVACRIKKSRYSRLEEYVFQSILEYFR